MILKKTIVKKLQSENEDEIKIDYMPEKKKDMIRE
jgi:hypothetical protein